MGKRTGAFVVLALALPLVPMAARAQGKPSGNLWTRSAELYLNQGLSANNDVDKSRFLKEALEQAQTATQKDPNNALAWQLAGKVHMAMGDLQGADSSLTRAEALYPAYVKEDAPVREQAWVQAYNAGVQALNANKMEAAIAAFEQADKVYQGRPSARMTLASIYANQREYDKAITEYQAALKILQGPGSKDLKGAELKQWQENTEKVLQRLGQLYAATKRYDDAVALLQSQLTATPNDASLQVDLARALSLSGKDSAAKAMFAQIVARPDLTDSQYFDAGIVLFRARDFGAAATAFRKAVHANPYNHGALYNLSQALLAQAQPLEEAREKAAPAERKTYATQLAPLFAELNDVTAQFLALEPANGLAIRLAGATARGLADIAATPVDEKANRDRSLKLLQRADSLQFDVSDVTLTDTGSDATLSGTVLNKRLTAGTPIALKFIFLGKDGATLDTQDISVTAPAKDQTAPFTVTTKARNVVGWKYELSK